MDHERVPRVSTVQKYFFSYFVDPIYFDWKLCTRLVQGVRHAQENKIEQD